jgi:Ca-activated chloride channel family protein
MPTCAAERHSSTGMTCKGRVFRLTRAAATAALLAAAPSSVHTTPSEATASGSSDLAVRITSPLGRTGGVGSVRIVAQIQPRPGSVLAPVRFYVDSTLFKTDADGPPYAVEWFDENPFERRELSVEVEDNHGNKARDKVVLEAFEINEVSEVSSVLLEAGVYDRKGHFISGLKPTQFVVREDGVPQAIDLVSHERVPATFTLLIDSSQSMSRRFDFVKDAASRLLTFLRPQDKVVVAPFSKQLAAVTGPTSDQRTIVDAIRHIEPTGGTAILDTLIELSQRLPRAEDRRSVILISDGYDEHSRATFDTALAAVKNAGLTIYVVGIGGVAGISLRGERELRRLAADTGGQVFFPPRPEELAEVYDRLAADAQNRYLVTYTPSNTARDGAWRAVTLTTSPAEYVVRTRAGYRAPKPPPIRPTLEFTVTDASGAYVEISADDLLVSENGVEQKVDTFHEALTPVSIVLALDSSGSMKKSADALVAAARTFVESLRPEDNLELLYFSDGVLVAHDFTTNRQPTLDAIAAYRPAGGTALYDALGGAFDALKRVQGRRAVVVMTDGRDENNAGTAPGSRRTLAQILDLAREIDATVLPIGLGTNLDRHGLERIAEISGGMASFPADVSELREQFSRTVENLRRRYVLGYTSTNAARDGSWREVEIRSRSTRHVIRSRSGYYAPER